MFPTTNTTFTPQEAKSVPPMEPLCVLWYTEKKFKKEDIFIFLPVQWLEALPSYPTSTTC